MPIACCAGVEKTQKRLERPSHEAVGTLPATLAALAVHSAERNEAGALEPGLKM